MLFIIHFTYLCPIIKVLLALSTALGKRKYYLQLRNINNRTKLI